MNQENTEKALKEIRNDMLGLLRGVSTSFEIHLYQRIIDFIDDIEVDANGKCTYPEKY